MYTLTECVDRMIVSSRDNIPILLDMVDERSELKDAQEFVENALEFYQSEMAEFPEMYWRVSRCKYILSLISERY